jgi:uncharacterized membrane protein
MNDRTKRVARLSVLSAVGVVLSFLANVLPAGRLGLMILASFPVCIALMMYGWGWALGVYAITAVLALALFPGQSAIGYGLFFGYYPIAKSLMERIHKRFLCWAAKYGLFCLVFVVYWAMARGLYDYHGVAWLGLFAGFGLAFAVYDVCYSFVIQFYLDKLARYFR